MHPSSQELTVPGVLLQGSVVTAVSATRPARVVTFAVRVVLGALWVWAALAKIADPAAAVRAVRAFQILPEALVHPVAYGLPYFEIVVAAALIIGLRTRIAALASATLLAVFAGAIASAWIRGLAIDCGCFGGGGTVDPDATRYTAELLRDAGLVALSALAAVFAPGSFSTDRSPALLAHRMHQRRPFSPRGRAIRQHAAVARRRLVVTVGAALVAVTTVAVGTASSVARNATQAPSTVPARVTTDNGFVVGSDAAPVTIDIFEDFQCPGCAQFAVVSGDTLENLTASGQARVVYHVLTFLGPESVRAANAAALAHDRGRFEAFYRYLYAHQPPEQSGGYTDADLIVAGGAVGITDADFASGVKTLRYKDWVSATNEFASRAGVVQTPTVLVNGRAVAHPGPDQLRAAVAAAR